MKTAAQEARRTLLGLLMMIVTIAGILAFNSIVNKKDWVPGLALDLKGGEEIILTATKQDGGAPDSDLLGQAVDVIRKRVDASGVAEADIATIGTDQIKVSLPGTPDPNVLKLVKNAAQLQFRPVLWAYDPTSPDAATTKTIPDNLAANDPQASIATGTPSSYEYITQDVIDAWNALDCLSPQESTDMGKPKEAFVACGEIRTSDQGVETAEKYVLGPVEIYGSQVARATSGPYVDQQGNVRSNQYEVALSFSKSGKTAFTESTTRLVAFGVGTTRDRFAIVLDGTVVSAPTVQVVISGGAATISRESPPMTQDEASTLANQLRYGAIPLVMTVDSDSRVGATIGESALKSGLLAGLIGLILVVLYSILQYRALAIVTVGSLTIAAVLTMGTICVMSQLLGYRLSLAGVAGLIVSIGVTADSFIVYFERIRDELRDGRTLPAAVSHGWTRARRTVFASDAVSLLAAIALYMTAVGNVRGFAFTLGLTTVIDLIVLTRFTHPILVLISTTRFFGEGHRFSGLDPRLLGRGVTYKGRGRVEFGKPTLAERRAGMKDGGA